MFVFGFCIILNKKKSYFPIEISKGEVGFFYLGFNTNPKNGRVKALSEACLDRTYSTIFYILN